MGALKTADNGKPMERTQRVSDPQTKGKLPAGRVYWLIGLIVGGVVVMMAVAMCTVLVYGHRLETLQSRVDVLEQLRVDVETKMRNYVDERLRIVLSQQVSKYTFYLTRFHFMCVPHRAKVRILLGAILK